MFKVNNKGNRIVLFENVIAGQESLLKNHKIVTLRQKIKPANSSALKEEEMKTESQEQEAAHIL